MGYLLLSIALLCGVIKGYCGKRSGGSLTHTADAIIINIVRMLFCLIIEFALVLTQNNIHDLFVSGSFLMIALLSGVATAFFVVSWLLSVQKCAYMMVDVFLLIGVILPLLLCRLFFGEEIRLIQWLGILLLVIAGLIICSYNTSIKGKMTLGAVVLLILCAVSNGIADYSQKLFVKTCQGGNIAVFNLYTYLFALFFLLLCYLIFRLKERKNCDLESPVKIVPPNIGYVLVMAICLFLNSYFKTKSALYLTAAQIYPLSQGGSVILSLLMSALIFREKINARCIVGVIISFVALIMINIL